MRVSNHIIAAGTIGTSLYLWSNDLKLAGGFVVAAVAIDLDHFTDHCLFSARPLKIRTLFIPGYPASYSRIVFALHSYELLLIFFLFAIWVSSSLVWGLLAGWAVHLAMDEVGNRIGSDKRILHPLFYFFFFRLARKFHVNRISSLNKKQTSAIDHKNQGIVK